MTVKFELNGYAKQRIIKGEQEKDSDFPGFTYTYSDVKAIIRLEEGGHAMICENPYGEVWRKFIPWQFQIVLVLP